MPLDPKVQAMLAAQEALGIPPLKALQPDAARANSIARLVWADAPTIVVAQIEDRSIPGPAGDLPMRIYSPEGGGPFPLLMYFHGGGFVVCNLDTHDRICRGLCRDAGCVVVSVDYRLAPEHPFPAGSDDCLAATRWAAEHASELNADPARIAVSGDSAGGNLAAVTALRIRDQGGPALRGQFLIYPVTDHYSADMPSYEECAEGYGLSRDDMIWFWDHYLAQPADAAQPYAAPLRAADLSNLPPALVLSAEYDPLRDEAERYAERLQAAGVPTVLSRYESVNHGFVNQLGVIDQAEQAIEEGSAWLRKVLA